VTVSVSVAAVAAVSPSPSLSFPVSSSEQIRTERPPPFAGANVTGFSVYLCPEIYSV